MFLKELHDTESNYWLNALITIDKTKIDKLLKKTNDNGIMSRPAWTPMYHLEIYKNCQKSNLENTEWLFKRIVSLPSSVII